MQKNSIIGIDLGGTKISGGRVSGEAVTGIISEPINARGSYEEVLQEVFRFTDALIKPGVKAIGIGVPGLVLNGIVYDVMFIPAWKEIPLQALLEERYKVPVMINNDANCFALGEFYFGKGRQYESMVGLTLGTGMGCGIIIHKKLYSGSHSGAGEFGLVPYLDQCYEYYASGQFFQNKYGTNGETVFSNAKQGDAISLKMYAEMGTHLGNAIKTILYCLDVELIVLGGSVRHAFPFFSKSLWESLDNFVFKRSLADLRIEVSELENSGILGAAALHYDIMAVS
jgi:glucokinase